MEAVYMGHVTFRSKQGEDMTIFYYSYEDARVKGCACDKAFIYHSSSNARVPEGLGGGEPLDLDFDKNGRLLGIKLATPIK